MDRDTKSSPNMKTSTSKGTVAAEINNFDRYVLVGTRNGEPVVWTSEQDTNKATDLIRRGFPALAGLEHAT